MDTDLVPPLRLLMLEEQVAQISDHQLALLQANEGEQEVEQRLWVGELKANGRGLEVKGHLALCGTPPGQGAYRLYMLRPEL